METAALHGVAPRRGLGGPGQRELSGERVRRIVAATRDSIAERGIAGSTFAQVSRRAGVSRGLLHYYFGTKERLLVEVLRHDSDLRVAALDQALGPAASLDEVIEVLVARLEDLVENDPGFFTLVVELFVAGRTNEEIRFELAEHYRRARSRVVELLEQKRADGALSFRFQPDAVFSYLLAGGEGLALQMIADPERDHTATIEAAASAARHLLEAQRSP